MPPKQIAKIAGMIIQETERRWNSEQRDRDRVSTLYGVQAEVDAALIDYFTSLRKRDKADAG